MAERPDLDGRDPATLTELLDALAHAYPVVAELVRERDALRDHVKMSHEKECLLIAERDQAYAALPASVAGDAAPEAATLADRIRALVMERDREHASHGECHRLHQLAELRAIEQRARQVATGAVTNGAPWQQNAEIARYILRESS